MAQRDLDNDRKVTSYRVPDPSVWFPRARQAVAVARLAASGDLVWQTVSVLTPSELNAPNADQSTWTGAALSSGEVVYGDVPWRPCEGASRVPACRLADDPAYCRPGNSGANSGLS